MNIIAMVGSLQNNSFNRRIFEAYQALAKDEFNFAEIKTSDFPHYNQDQFAEGMRIVTPHAKSIADADGILFFSAEYNYSLPGHLKNALDWISKHEPQPFNNKKAAVIGASPGKLGTARMQYDLRKIGVFLNLHFLNKPEVMIAEAHQKMSADGKLTDEPTLTFLRDHIQAFKAFMSVR